MTCDTRDTATNNHVKPAISFVGFEWSLKTGRTAKKVHVSVDAISASPQVLCDPTGQPAIRVCGHFSIDGKGDDVADIVGETQCKLFMQHWHESQRLALLELGARMEQERSERGKLVLKSINDFIEKNFANSAPPGFTPPDFASALRDKPYTGHNPTKGEATDPMPHRDTTVRDAD